MTLSPYEQWMVAKNIEHAREEDLAVILAALRRNGYPAAADAVEEACKAQR